MPVYSLCVAKSVLHVVASEEVDRSPSLSLHETYSGVPLAQALVPRHAALFCAFTFS